MCAGVDVVVFISNCKKSGGAQRLRFIKELMSYIPVHSYGGCLNNRKEKEIPNDPRWPAHDQRRARKLKTLEHYKFYLAFENLGVSDYVSEKVYEGLIAGTLPVYRGAEGISKFLPDKKAAINANHMSAREIADILLALSKDEDAYDEYFAYKKRPIADSFVEVAQRSYCHPNALCRLCDYGLNYRKTHARRALLQVDSIGNITSADPVSSH
ncbi:fut11 [Symbiodinium microadriaticum]|nr:fut11 [Symbiodinium microadriaticum]